VLMLGDGQHLGLREATERDAILECDHELHPVTPVACRKSQSRINDILIGKRN
jgi:hypothetical protein